jgi:hypothetical protein
MLRVVHTAGTAAELQLLQGAYLCCLSLLFAIRLFNCTHVGQKAHVNIGFVVDKYCLRSQLYICTRRTLSCITTASTVSLPEDSVIFCHSC